MSALRHTVDPEGVVDVPLAEDRKQEDSEEWHKTLRGTLLEVGASWTMQGAVEVQNKHASVE